MWLSRFKPIISSLPELQTYFCSRSFLIFFRN